MTPARWLAAFVAAPIVPSLLVGAIPTLFGGSGAQILLVVLVVEYGAMVVVGLPLYALFLRKHQPSRLRAALLGSAVATSPWLLLALIAMITTQRRDIGDIALGLLGLSPYLLLAIVMGALGGLIAWHVAYWQPKNATT